MYPQNSSRCVKESIHSFWIRAKDIMWGYYLACSCQTPRLRSLDFLKGNISIWLIGISLLSEKFARGCTNASIVWGRDRDDFKEHTDHLLKPKLPPADNSHLGILVQCHYMFWFFQINLEIQIFIQYLNIDSRFVLVFFVYFNPKQCTSRKLDLVCWL